MLSRQKDFLFIHIPKTGGNSIQSILQKYSEDQITIEKPYQDGVERFQVRSPDLPTRKHSPLRDYRKLLGSERIRSLFKFAVVRSPWDRLVSSYFSPHRGNTEWNRDEFVALVNESPSMVSFLDSRNLPSLVNPFLRPRVDVDFVIRFENLQEDFDRVCDRLGIPREQLPHRNQSSRKPYQEYYDGELRELVGKHYADDVWAFGYEFGRCEELSDHGAVK
ncbi:MAG: sulfotransferase family 2 domain-containing protein [Planctomycetaceae bacterium]